MYIDGHATENYDASTLKVYASIRITQILGNLTHAQTHCTRPVFSSPAKNGLGTGKLYVRVRAELDREFPNATCDNSLCACGCVPKRSIAEILLKFTSEHIYTAELV